MNIVDQNSIMTLEEVAQLLKLGDVEPIMAAVNEGGLPVIQIGAERRIVGKDLNEYLARNRSTSDSAAGNTQRGPGGRLVQTRGNDYNLKAGQPFTHRWPDESKEKFRDVLTGSIRTASGVHALKIGFTTRKAAGQDRERAVVFIDGRPIVEFCGADDFEKSKTMASVIKVHGKQVKPIQGVPSELRHLRVDAYNKHVTGPYASTNLAVLCKKDDCETMVSHALIRQTEIENKSSR